MTAVSPIAAVSNAAALSVDASSKHDVLLNDLIQLSRCRIAAAAGAQLPLLHQSSPLFVAADRGVVERGDALLHGETISCFVVGGERRLCFPQVISQVLRDVSLDDVNRAFQALNIHCSVANPEQLLCLKLIGHLPLTAESCGLITKTDAERLVHRLLYEQRPPATAAVTASSAASNRRQSSSALPVEHDCFGGARGRWLPELMHNSTSACIECDECLQLFAPDRFCTHSHSDGECRRVCHWGFDPTNWRHYLHLPDAIVGDTKAEAKLHLLKSNFTVAAAYAAAAMSPPLLVARGAMKRPVDVTPTAYYGALLPTTEKRAKLDVISADQIQQFYAEMLQKSLIDKRIQLQTPTADAAVGLLALSSSGGGGKCAEQSKSLSKVPGEPLKKHLLHQFEVEQQQVRQQQHQQQQRQHQHQTNLEPTDVVSQTERPESESTTSASESEDEPSLDALLEQHIPNAHVRRVIRSKIADSQRMLEMSIDALQTEKHLLTRRGDALAAQVHLLQTENAALRKSHPNHGSSSDTGRQQQQQQQQQHQQRQQQQQRQLQRQQPALVC